MNIKHLVCLTHTNLISISPQIPARDSFFSEKYTDHLFIRQISLFQDILIIISIFIFAQQDSKQDSNNIKIYSKTKYWHLVSIHVKEHTSSFIADISH